MSEFFQHERRVDDTRLKSIEDDLRELKATVQTLSRDVEDLVAAWKAANWLVSFVKWAGGLSLSITAIYTLFKGIK